MFESFRNWRIVFRSFNPPISANNWANVFIQEPDEKAVTLLTNYTQVPPEWLGEAFLYEAERLKALNYKAYEHEYMGIATGTGGEVFPNLEIREITEEEISRMGYIYQGLDFGFAVDPAAFIRVAYDRKTDTVYFWMNCTSGICPTSSLQKLSRTKDTTKAKKPATAAISWANTWKDT